LLSDRENYIRNARFQGPEWIPMYAGISNASWDQHRKEMEKVALRHPDFFPYVKEGWRNYDNFDFGPGYTKGVPFIDEWGCTWLSAVNGLQGAVINEPLQSWDDLESYHVPDAEVTADWEQIERNIRQAKAEGRLTQGGPSHGFIFLQLQYLRGFENLMVDMALGEPKLARLIDMLIEHNMKIVENYLRFGVDILEFGDDLGTQTATIISPADLRKWIMPAYAKLAAPCKTAGVLIAMHSDGRTLEILEDQIAAGVEIVNPQDLCNGIDNLAKYIKGKACIRLDVDRQSIVPFGTRKDIHDLIEEEVRKLGDPRGGLEFIVGIYPPTPPENVDALCEAFGKFRTYWWD